MVAGLFSAIIAFLIAAVLGINLNQVYEYILFAGLLLVATVIFIIICCYYKYIEDEESHGEEDENDDDSSVSTSKKLSLNYEKQSNGSFKVKTSHGIFNKSTYHSNLF